MVGLGLLVLRLALGVVFIAHGGNKLFGAFATPGIGPGGLQNTAAFFASVGLEPAFILAVIDGVLELAGGLLLAFGLLTRWVAAGLAISMGIAIWKVHFQWGFFLNWTGAAGGHGMEFPIVLAAALIALALTGGGDLSVDGFNQQSSARAAAGRARLRGKM